MTRTVTAAEAVLPLIPTAEETLVRETIGKIVDGYGHVYYQQCSSAQRPMEELWSELGEAGFLGVNTPVEYGGSGQGLTELAVICEEMGAHGCPELFLVLSQGIGVTILTRHGTQDQKNRYLP